MPTQADIDPEYRYAVEIHAYHSLHRRHRQLQRRASQSPHKDAIELRHLKTEFNDLFGQEVLPIGAIFRVSGRMSRLARKLMASGALTDFEQINKEALAAPTPRHPES